MRNSKFYSNGKLLLTGEYAVLDGALALAIPTKFGQLLEINSIDKPKVIWKSFDEKDALWFKSDFAIENIGDETKAPNNIEDRLIQILCTARALNPRFLSDNQGYQVTTKLTFPKHWGLGTSSTLINNIAQWADVDPYKLLELTFGGSGYDIACAKNNTPITYQLTSKTTEKRVVKSVNFNPSFKKNIFFVYLNKKQNSREGIKHYHANKQNATSCIKDINLITEKVISCENLEDFETLIDKHENIIGDLTNQTPLKKHLFNNHKGSIKSLGAWGGDFIMVTSRTNPEAYFKEKGFNTIIPYEKMVL